MIRKDDSHYVLSSGREVYAHHGLIGLAHQTGGHTYPNLTPSYFPWGEPTFGLFEVGEGFDGHVYDLDEWTPAERAELADFMIAQWQAFREAIKGLDR